MLSTADHPVGRRVVGGLVAALTSLALVAGCGSPQPEQPEPIHVDITREQYDTPRGLARDSSVIVRGRLGAVGERTVDDGGGAGPAIPTLLYRFRVADQAAGSQAPSTITLAWVDASRVEMDGAVTLRPGGRYLLFLNRVPESERAGLRGRGTIYTPVGMNAGIFTLSGGTARPADPALRGPGPQARSSRPGAGRPAGIDPADLLALRPGQR